MTEHVRLKIYDIVGSPIWVSTEDGQKVYDKIVEVFQSGRGVELSFTNHQVVITAFLNAAIAQLYSGDFSEEFLRTHLAFTELGEDDQVMIDRAVANARRYFANRKGYDQAWKDTVDEGDE